MSSDRPGQSLSATTATAGAAGPRVTILMCTRNGAAHLPEQLESFLRQSHGDWGLWVSDDGSTDATPAILRGFRDAHPGRDIRLFDGPRRGAAQNFLSLLTRPDLAEKSGRAADPDRLVALSDQDDIWLPHKLARAVQIVANARNAGAARTAGVAPLLYSAQCLYADATGRRTGASRPPPRGTGLANALVQNVVAGHAMVLDAAAVDLVRRAGLPPAPPRGPEYHDWWLYPLVSAAGGRVIVDDAPVLLYRQHGHNVMGAPRGMAARLARLRGLFGRDYARWMQANLDALEAAAANGVTLTPEARIALDRLRAKATGWGRVCRLRAAGVHRQTALGTLCLMAAAAAGRL